PVAAGKHRARGELQSRKKILPNQRDFHSTRGTNGPLGVHIYTCFRARLSYGNEGCGRAFNFCFSTSFRSRKGGTGGTQSRGEGHAAAGGIGLKLRVSENETRLPK